MDVYGQTCSRGYILVNLWSKEVLMDRSRCRSIRTLGVTDIGSAGGDGDR